MASSDNPILFNGKMRTIEEIEDIAKQVKPDKKITKEELTKLKPSIVEVDIMALVMEEIEKLKQEVESLKGEIVKLKNSKDIVN